MKKFLACFALVIVGFLPACCVFRPGCGVNSAALPLQLEKETVATVKWIGPVLDDKGDPIHDDDGNEVLGEADPDKNPKAYLVPTCSGVWISNDKFLTAEHCVDNLGKPDIMQVLEAFGLEADKPWDPTGQPLLYSAFGDVGVSHDHAVRTTHKAVVLAVDLDHDLAIVQATPDLLDQIPDHPVAPIASSTTIGEDVHVVGHMGGMWWTYSRGYMSAVRDAAHGPGKDNDVLQVAAPVWLGNSGGGAFNSKGELLGIASYISRRAPGMGFFVNYELIARFLRRNGIKS